jgi:hypothetical protein
MGVLNGLKKHSTWFKSQKTQNTTNAGEAWEPVKQSVTVAASHVSTEDVSAESSLGKSLIINHPDVRSTFSLSAQVRAVQQAWR